MLKPTDLANGLRSNIRTISLIRHGATSLNNDDVSVDRIRGWSDVPLSKEGKEEALKLGEEIRGNPPDHLVTSDLQRAHETANVISQLSGVPISEVSQGFRPWNVGHLTGESSESAVPKLIQYATKQPQTPVPGGESFNDFKQRFFSSLGDALAKYPGHLAIVTHHRNERLVKSWAAAGYPANGNISARVFTTKGDPTGGREEVKIPVDRLPQNYSVFARQLMAQ